MYKFYVVPDATKLSTHSEIYSPTNMKLFWDPRSESDAYAILEAKGKEELNKAGSLEFSILPTNICYNDFQKRKTVVLAYDDDELIFEGCVTANPRDFYKQRKITCSGTLVYLADTVQAPDEKNEIVVPGSSGEDMYVQVPLTWYDGVNPRHENWYERSVNNGLTYAISSDTTANPSKTYYYKVTSSGENVSGTTITRSAATSESIQAHISKILSVHNTQVEPYKRIFDGQINDDDTDSHDFASTGWRTSWDALNSDILQSYGRYVTVTKASNGTLALNYLDIDDMSDQAPVIEYAVNMLDMSESNDSNDDVFTVLVPIGKDNLTVAGASGHNSGGNGEIDPYIVSWGGARRYVIVSKAAVARYGYIVKTQSFTDIEDANALYNKAVEYISNNYDYHTEYDVKAIDLKVLGESDHRISIGDRCRIKSAWHEVDEQDLYVLSVDRDYINPENDSFKIGVPTSDKEAGNRRLSSQTSNNKTASRNNASNYSSGSTHTSSILESYIHVTEWGLEMNSKLKNEVESNDGKYLTRFLQEEGHINLAAQKLFGVDGDGRGDLDAGYVQVLKSEYKDGDKPYKNPNTEHWFEKVNGQYVVSKDTTCDPSIVGSKTYYVQRLWTRYSDIDVGPGGIKSRVDGNYETATYCSSWIQSNEDAILALTGHLYVDSDGHAHITSGSGMRTDHAEDKTTPTYFQVQRSMYAQNPNPSAKGWYVRKLDSSGAWVGQGKVDSATNDAYYVLTSDTMVDSNKHYYYKSNIRETFLAEYGVYDQDNLTGGLVVQMINNPSYHIVSKDAVRDLLHANGSPRAQGWYEYNKSTGTYGITLDETANPSKDYYTVTNNQQSYSDIWGEHIVVGRTASYSGLDNATKAKVDRYIRDNHLDGTITEIASDVVVVNTLLAKYIEADEIVADTSLSTDNFDFNNGMCFGQLEFWTGSGFAQQGTTIDWDNVSTNNIDTGAIMISGPNHEVVFGSGYTTLGEAENPENIVVGFGTITTSGDKVNIPYYLAGDDTHNDTNNVLSFDKPASLGRAVWSNGKVEIYTTGGWAATPQWKFYEAHVDIPTIYQGSTRDGSQDVLAYSRNGSRLTSSLLLRNKPVLRATMEITGEDSDRFGNPVAFGHDSSDDSPIISAWSKDIFLDATLPYEDGYDQGESYAKSHFRLVGPTDSLSITNQSEAMSAAAAGALSYGTTYGVWLTYEDVLFGYKSFFKVPSKGALRSYAKYGNTEYTDGTINLDYGESITVYGQRKMDGESSWSNAAGIQIKAPSDNSSPSYTSGDIRVGSTDIKQSKPSDATELSWGSTVASADGKWFVFEAWINGVSGTKKYAIDLS